MLLARMEQAGRLENGSAGFAKKLDGWQKMRWLDSITDSVNMNLSKNLGDSGGQGSLVCCSPRDQKESDVT